MGEDYRQKFAAIFPALAEANQATLLPFLLDGVGGEVELNQNDGVHPTADGHRIVAENLWKTLLPLLR
jgi:acyl-CoA thioesterase-1